LNEIKEKIPTHDPARHYLPTTDATNSEPAGTPKNQTLKPPRQKHDWETIIKGLYERDPKLKQYESPQLLLFLKDWARQQGVEIKLSDGRIRQLKIWKENAIHRESGSTRHGYNDANSDIYAVEDEEPDFDL
jgi:hypothetical protein